MNILQRATLVLALIAGCSGGIDDRALAARQYQETTDVELPPVDGTAGAASDEGDDGEPMPPPIATDQPDAAAPEPPAPSVLNAPPMCTSGTSWVDEHESEADDDDEEELEVEGDPRMHPGVACVSCHSVHDGPRFAIGGTVYPSAHEPDDCNGLDGQGALETSVVITDATGRVLTLAVNAVGNFHSDEADSIVMPIRAKVVQGGVERVMFGERMTGDCNSCHTQDGANGAPGRILTP
jgi:mono/diheme cytochrome c family protein